MTKRETVAFGLNNRQDGIAAELARALARIAVLEAEAAARAKAPSPDRA